MIALARLGVLVGALLLGATGCSPYGHLLSSGDKLADAGRWDEAARSYEQALAERPDSADARTRLRVARWNQSRERAVRARALLERGEVFASLRLASEAIAIDAAVPETQKIHDEASRRAADQVEQLEQSGQLDQALAQAIELRELDPRNQRAAQAEVRLRERIAALAYERAERLLASDRPGAALLAFRDADRVREGYRDAAARAEVIRERLARSLRFHLAVATRDDAPSAAVARGLRTGTLDPKRPLLVLDDQPPPGAQGARVEPALSPPAHDHDVRALRRSCSYVCGVDLVANPEHAARTRRVADAQRRSRDADAEERTSRAALRDAQNALDQAAAAHTAAQQATSLAQTALESCRRREQDRKGERKGPPPCARLQERLSDSQREEQRQRAQREAAESTARRARDSAERDERAARQAHATWDDEVSRLARTPSTLEQERVCPHSYGVEVHTLAARSTRSLTVEPLGALRPAPLAPRELLASAVDETFPPQAQRCAELVAGDPLSLPSEDTLDRRLVQAAVEDVQQAVRAWYDDYARGYLDESRRAQASGRPVEALEAQVRHQLLTGSLPPAR